MNLHGLLQELGILAENARRVRNSEGVSRLSSEFEQVLQRFVNQQAINVSDRLLGLQHALQLYGDLLPQLPSGAEVEKWGHGLFMTSARLVLGADFSKLKTNDLPVTSFKSTLTVLYSRLQNHAVGHYFLVLQWLLVHLWNHPTLVQMMKGEDDIDRQRALTYLRSGEYPELIRLRVDMLAEGGLLVYSLNLCNWCLQSPSFQEDIPLRLTQLLLLHKLSRQEEFHNQCWQVSCCQGVQILEHLVRHPELSDSQAVSLMLAQTFLLQDWMKPAKYCCTQKLLDIWLNTQRKVEPDTGQFLQSISKVAQLAQCSTQLNKMTQALHSQFSKEFLQLCTELCVNAMKMDRSLLDTAKAQKQDKGLSAAIEGLVATARLTAKIYEGHPEVQLASHLTALYLEPSAESFQRTLGLKENNVIRPEIMCPPVVHPNTLKELLQMLNSLRPAALNLSMDTEAMKEYCLKIMSQAGVAMPVPPGQLYPSPSPPVDNILKDFQQSEANKLAEDLPDSITEVTPGPSHKVKVSGDNVTQDGKDEDKSVAKDDDVENANKDQEKKDNDTTTDPVQSKPETEGETKTGKEDTETKKEKDADDHDIVINVKVPVDKTAEILSNPTTSVETVVTTSTLDDASKAGVQGSATVLPPIISMPPQLAQLPLVPSMTTPTVPGLLRPPASNSLPTSAPNIWNVAQQVGASSQMTPRPPFLPANFPTPDFIKGPPASHSDQMPYSSHLPVVPGSKQNMPSHLPLIPQPPVSDVEPGASQEGSMDILSQAFLQSGLSTLSETASSVGPMATTDDATKTKTTIPAYSHTPSDTRTPIAAEQRGWPRPPVSFPPPPAPTEPNVNPSVTTSSGPSTSSEVDSMTPEAVAQILSMIANSGSQQNPSTSTSANHPAAQKMPPPSHMYPPGRLHGEHNPGRMHPEQMSPRLPMEHSPMQRFPMPHPQVQPEHRFPVPPPMHQTDQRFTTPTSMPQIDQRLPSMRDPLGNPMSNWNIPTSSHTSPNARQQPPVRPPSVPRPDSAKTKDVNPATVSFPNIVDALLADNVLKMQDNHNPQMPVAPYPHGMPPIPYGLPPRDPKNRKRRISRKSESELIGEMAEQIPPGLPQQVNPYMCAMEQQLPKSTSDSPGSFSSDLPPISSMLFTSLPQSSGNPLTGEKGGGLPSMSKFLSTPAGQMEAAHKWTDVTNIPKDVLRSPNQSTSTAVKENTQPAHSQPPHPQPAHSRPPRENIPEYQKQSFPCPYCLKEFPSVSEKRRHQENACTKRRMSVPSRLADDRELLYRSPVTGQLYKKPRRRRRTRAEMEAARAAGVEKPARPQIRRPRSVSDSIPLPLSPQEEYPATPTRVYTEAPEYDDLPDEVIARRWKPQGGLLPERSKSFDDSMSGMASFESDVIPQPKKPRHYKCYFCNQYFDSRHHLNKHRDKCKLETKLENPYVCSYCSLEFPSVPSLNGHLLSKHRGGLTSGTPSLLCQRINIKDILVLKVIKFICSCCINLFENMKQWEEHKRQCMPEATCERYYEFKCMFCHAAFESRNRAYTHCKSRCELYKEHIHEEEQNAWRCKLCKMVFSSPADLNAHLLTKHTKYGKDGNDQILASETAKMVQPLEESAAAVQSIAAPGIVEETVTEECPENDLTPVAIITEPVQGGEIILQADDADYDPEVTAAHVDDIVANVAAGKISEEPIVSETIITMEDQDMMHGQYIHMAPDGTPKFIADTDIDMNSNRITQDPKLMPSSAGHSEAERVRVEAMETQPDSYMYKCSRCQLTFLTESMKNQHEKYNCLVPYSSPYDTPETAELVAESAAEQPYSVVVSQPQSETGQPEQGHVDLVVEVEGAEQMSQAELGQVIRAVEEMTRVNKEQANNSETDSAPETNQELYVQIKGDVATEGDGHTYYVATSGPMENVAVEYVHQEQGEVMLPENVATEQGVPPHNILNQPENETTEHNDMETLPSEQEAQVSSQDKHENVQTPETDVQQETKLSNIDEVPVTVHQKVPPDSQGIQEELQPQKPATATETVSENSTVYKHTAEDTIQVTTQTSTVQTSIKDTPDKQSDASQNISPEVTSPTREAALNISTSSVPGESLTPINIVPIDSDTSPERVGQMENRTQDEVETTVEHGVATVENINVESQGEQDPPLITETCNVVPNKTDTLDPKTSIQNDQEAGNAHNVIIDPSEEKNETEQGEKQNMDTRFANDDENSSTMQDHITEEETPEKVQEVEMSDIEKITQSINQDGKVLENDKANKCKESKIMNEKSHSSSDKSEQCASKLTVNRVTDNDKMGTDITNSDKTSVTYSERSENRNDSSGSGNNSMGDGGSTRVYSDNPGAFNDTSGVKKAKSGWFMLPVSGVKPSYESCPKNGKQTKKNDSQGCHGHKHGHHTEDVMKLSSLTPCNEVEHIMSEANHRTQDSQKSSIIRNCDNSNTADNVINSSNHGTKSSQPDAIHISATSQNTGDSQTLPISTVSQNAGGSHNEVLHIDTRTVDVSQPALIPISPTFHSTEENEFQTYHSEVYVPPVIHTELTPAPGDGSLSCIGVRTLPTFTKSSPLVSKGKRERKLRMAKDKALVKIITAENEVDDACRIAGYQRVKSPEHSPIKPPFARMSTARRGRRRPHHGDHIPSGRTDGELVCRLCDFPRAFSKRFSLICHMKWVHGIDQPPDADPLVGPLSPGSVTTGSNVSDSELSAALRVADELLSSKKQLTVKLKRIEREYEDEFVEVKNKYMKSPPRNECNNNVKDFVLPKTSHPLPKYSENSSSSKSVYNDNMSVCEPVPGVTPVEVTGGLTCHPSPQVNTGHHTHPSQVSPARPGSEDIASIKIPTSPPPTNKPANPQHKAIRKPSQNLISKSNIKTVRASPGKGGDSQYNRVLQGVKRKLITIPKRPVTRTKLSVKELTKQRISAKKEERAAAQQSSSTGSRSRSENQQRPRSNTPNGVVNKAKKKNKNSNNKGGPGGGR